jgi:hypothetical protein
MPSEPFPMSAVTNSLRAGRREWIGLAVIALPCLLYSMDLTVLNLAVPALSADLKPMLVRRMRPAFVMAAGLLLAAVGLAVLTRVSEASGLTVLVTGSVLRSCALLARCRTPEVDRRPLG